MKYPQEARCLCLQLGHKSSYFMRFRDIFNNNDDNNKNIKLLKILY